MKQRVVILEALDYLGGGQKLAIEVAQALLDHCDVYLILPGPGPFSLELDRRGISYQFLKGPRLPRGGKRLWDVLTFAARLPFDLFRLYRCLARLRPDLIYANAAPTFVSTAIVATLLRIPVVWHVHNSFVDGKTVKLLRSLGRLGCIKKIACDSLPLAEQFPGLPHKTVILAPCIHLDQFQSFARDSGAIRERLGIAPGTKVFLQIGWVMRAKCQHCLVEAAKRIWDRRRDVCFLIVGKNLEDEKDYLQFLNDRIQEYGLESAVRILGFVEDFRPLLEQAYGNIIASREGLPIVMLEAAAFGVPTLAPDVGGPGVVIQHGQTGLIYRFQDPDALAAALLSLLEDSDLHERIKVNLPAFVQQHTMAQYHRQVNDHVGTILGIPTDARAVEECR